MCEFPPSLAYPTGSHVLFALAEPIPRLLRAVQLQREERARACLFLTWRHDRANSIFGSLAAGCKDTVADDRELIAFSLALR